MSRVRVLPGGRVALPVEVRERLQLEEGDDLELELIEGGLLLRRAAEPAREQAWRELLDTPQAVRYVGPEPRPSPQEEEEWLAEEIKAARLEEHAKGRR